MTHAALMAEIDAYVAEGRGGYRGWHEQQTETYAPALQQCRAEFAELMHAASRLGHRGAALQIGLGHPGGSHWALRRVFRHVASIDTDGNAINRYIQHNGIDDCDHLFHGSSQEPRILYLAGMAAPFDFLFIDGDHTYAGVRADWQNYAPLVRPGGIIAFHDTYKEQPGCDVPRFIADLESEGQLLHHLRHPDPALAVGISLYYKRG